MVDFVLLELFPGVGGSIPPFFDSIFIPALMLSIIILWIGNTLLKKLGYALW